jgi:two-component system chemotaxis sensor kinase CheA
MDDLLQHFIVEAHELIQQATDDLLALERNPQAKAPMDSAFRAVHTLKGSVGLFDLAPMGIALHAAEDLLGALKEKRAGIDSHVIDSLFACIAQVERWVAVIEQTGQLPADAVEVTAWHGLCARSSMRILHKPQIRSPKPILAGSRS